MAGSGPEARFMAAEAEVTGTRRARGVCRAIPFYTDEGAGKEMHFEPYAVFRANRRATLKVGQFVVPFGNLPYYETPGWCRRLPL